MVERGAVETEVVATARECTAGGVIREVGQAGCFLPAGYVAAHAAD